VITGVWKYRGKSTGNVLIKEYNHSGVSSSINP